MNAFVVIDDTNVNLAFNKTASQSSTHIVASRAVDGNQKTRSCTSGELRPWWSVDLGAAYDVGQVTVTNDDNPHYGKKIIKSV